MYNARATKDHPMVDQCMRPQTCCHNRDKYQISNCSINFDTTTMGYPHDEKLVLNDVGVSEFWIKYSPFMFSSGGDDPTATTARNTPSHIMLAPGTREFAGIRARAESQVTII